MDDYTINIIGFGFVGTAHGFLCEKNNVKFNVCDINEKQGNFNYFNNVSELVKHSEKNKNINYYVIATPTPSDSEGNCDISIVKSVLLQLNIFKTKETFVIIKSTITPGTTKMFNEQFPELNIVFCPEFLTEKNYLDDIYNANFIILGIPPKFDMSKYQKILKVMRLFYKHNSCIEIYMKSYEEAELFKYTLNTFFATKIAFFNEIHELCEKMGVNYENLKNIFHLDPRVGDYGTVVPGPDGKFSFSGKCLPKEIKAMVKLQDKLGLSTEFMNCVKKRGDDFRIKQMKNKKIENL